ncbi:MAG: hypothetical protein WA975_17835 [Mesorhizobium sp.]
MADNSRIPWAGGDCPVHPRTIVLPTYRGPEDSTKGIRIGWPCPAGRLDWSHDGSDDDIVPYQITQTAASEAGGACS